MGHPGSVTGTETSASDIGDGSEDGGAGGSGGGGDVAGAVVPGLPGEEGEGGGLFGVAGEALLVDGGDGAAELGEAVGEQGHQGRVAGSSAGDDVVDGVCGAGEGKDESAECVGDGFGGEGGGGGDGVFGFVAVAAAGFEEAGGVGGAELLASGGFGRGLAEEFFFELGGEDWRENFSGCRDAAVAVVGPGEELLGEGVDDHVAGAGVEGDDFVLRGCGGDDSEVADAADVLEDAGAGGMREENGIEEGDERRALTSGGHVCGAEVGDDGEAGGGGDERGLAELPGAGEAAARVRGGGALVVDGLAVAADESGFDFGVGDGGLDSFSVGEAEPPVEAGEFGGGGGGVGLSGHRGEDGLAEGAREGEGSVGEESEFHCGVAGSDPDQGDIDAVGGGSAHDASDDHRWVDGHGGDSSWHGGESLEFGV